ncbi:hypothetical protein J7I98_37870 [Streptomyces sp. ISL-98]|uniref:hypothetical protein n=1 Tax=Streptomyces sp. ISL-98 TaxID=2819192 RepID=UPI001BEBF33B|nr:hypothetical protein [Streptomyces sp. ISL-98]MBT2511470.1 hypothetical protein [Streptomyces sp. ISL-98]
MTVRIWQPVPDEPCGNVASHAAHRNWRGAECGVSGVPAAKTAPSVGAAGTMSRGLVPTLAGGAG